MSRFEAVVRIINQWLRLNAGIRTFHDPTDDVDAALRFLRAGQGVNKAKALRIFKLVFDEAIKADWDLEFNEDEKATVAQIRALFEALPDENVAEVVGQEPEQDVFFPVGHGPNEPGRKNDGE
jgi:hypothetical protein